LCLTEELHHDEVCVYQNPIIYGRETTRQRAANSRSTDSIALEHQVWLLLAEANLNGCYFVKVVISNMPT
jgi:hypothetical protein